MGAEFADERMVPRIWKGSPVLRSAPARRAGRATPRAAEAVWKDTRRRTWWRKAPARKSDMIVRLRVHR